jgi:hypothetical protein
MFCDFTNSSVNLIKRASLCLGWVSCLFAVGLTPSAQAEKLKFNKDIRPILSENCFFCHGPDSKKREADLRLDTFAGATADGAIVPGDPAKSEVMVRLLTHDTDDRMPPAKSKLAPLTNAEIAKMEQWIREGAEYEAHWSFIPLQRTQFTFQQQPGQSPVDQIVTSGLKGRGLKMQPEADPSTLIRRLSFDLTGLPPSPADVEAFTADYRKNPETGMEHWVKKLLASPAYGERMAVDWLDAARYADSYGFQVDRERDVWMWRDWVVKAFNENLSFDKFATWQLAGDLLPNPTDEQILATAFNRLHQQESEGGSVEEEYRVEYVADRVQTAATAFLGLTFECARCHDHKFDPIKHSEYYGLFSMFQNIDEAGLYSFFTPSPPTPALTLMDAPAKAQFAALQATVAELEKQTVQVRKQASAEYAAWAKQAKSASAVTIPGELAHFTFDALEAGNKSADRLHPTPPPSQVPTPPQPAKDAKDKKAKAEPSPTFAAVIKGDNKLVDGKLGKAVAFTGDDVVDLPLGNFKRHEPFSVSLWLKTPDVKPRAVVFHRSRAWTDAASRGYELLLEEGKLKWSLIHFWPGNAISIRTKKVVPINEWTQVVVVNDGSSRANGLKIYVNGALAEVEMIRDGLTKDITGGGGDNIALGERFRDRGFKGGMVDDFRVFGRELTALEATMCFDAPAADKAMSKKELSEEYFLATKHEGYQKHLEALKAAREKVTAFADSQKEIMVMREMAQPKKAYILFRGEYDQRREEVPPVTPEALTPFPEGAPKNRLGLAQWLTAPNHPLFARVTVNRIWQGIFGRGLVKTSEDFGSQGEKPLYPELLDWLALHFMESGWDVKDLIKTMVMSQTYRQRSIADAQTMADDPENQWLARGPRFRLPAEMIRDNALAASGLLKVGMGGPPVNPYEMTEAFKPAKATAGDGVYRRSLYTSWRRTTPPPAMLAFDAPRRAVCSAKRERTDSPLQALILLNGVQYVEAARVLGEKLHKDAKGDLVQMIDGAFMRCLSRKPDAAEVTICRQLYTEQLAHFKAHPKEAEEVLTTGTAKHDATIPAPDAAAATVLAQALMNHDASVVKR